MNSPSDINLLKVGMIFWEKVILWPSCLNNISNGKKFLRLLENDKFAFDCQGDFISNEITDKVYYGLNSDLWQYLKDNSESLSFIGDNSNFDDYFNSFYENLKSNQFLSAII